MCDVVVDELSKYSDLRLYWGQIGYLLVAFLHKWLTIKSGL